MASTMYLLGVSACAWLVNGCGPNQPPIQPLTTSVGKSVGTLVKTSGIIDVTNTCSPASPPAPDPNAWFSALPPINKRFPFVGFELWRNTTDACTSSRLDVYRAVVKFNMASVANLKGLVTQATLGVTTRALPAGVGAHASCIAFTGGAGSLVRILPATAATVPASGAGMLTILPTATPFPSGGTVFTFPKPWVAGTVTGATAPTQTIATGLGGAAFSVDVSNLVIGTVNAGLPELSWMLTSAFEGPLPGPVPAGVDCKTSYDVTLQLTHY